MLVWFCIRAKLRAHTLRHPCLARSSRCIDPLYFYNLLKSTSIASPRAKLASLVKGEVLSPEKIRATTGGIASPPSFACTNPSKIALSLSLFVGEELAPPVAPTFSIPATIAKGQQPLSPHKPPKTALSPEKALYPFTTQPFPTPLTSCHFSDIL